MSIFSKLGALIFAPTDAAGNPRQVINHDAQVWSTEVERIIQVALEGGDLLVYGSLSALNADLDHPAHTGAILIGESIADDGLYMKQGASGSGSWVKIGNVPGQGFVKATNAGVGTANAIAATTPVAVNETQLILLPITAANTASPVTVAFNDGAALTVKTVSGNDVAAGGLPAGSVMLGVVQGGDFRLLSDQASAGIQAAAEAAQVAAEAALAEMREKSVGAFPDNASADAFLTAEGLTKQKGTIYFNTTADVWRYWDGSAWQTFPYAIVADGGVTEEKLADDLKASADVLFTVGSGGDFATINDALEAASKLVIRSYVEGGFTVEVRLLTGFVMAEQVLLSQMDVGFVTITSVDPTVLVDTSFTAQALSTDDDIYPLFGGKDGAVLPTLDALFDCGATRRDGVAVMNNSHAMFKPGAGVLNARHGLKAIGGSSLTCYIEGLTQGGFGAGAGVTAGVKVPGCTGRALHVGFGSRAELPRSDFSGCSGDHAVYAIWKSDVDIYQSNCSGASGTGITSRDGSIVNARESNVSNCNRGGHALHGGQINLRYYENSWSGGATGGARNCTDYGLIANDGATITAEGIPVDGSKIGAHASNGSTITMVDGGAANCIERALYALAGGRIFANGVDASGCTGVEAVTADGAGSVIDFVQGDASGASGGAVVAHECGIINANGADLSGAATNAAFARRGALVNVRSANLQNAGDYGAYSFELGQIVAVSANASGAGTNGYQVSRGGIITANSAVGTLSQAAVTPTAAGTIYQ
ncbi:hypothetical protein ACLIR7_09625 [Nitratireductor aquimarinus]|uniref:hypothetical protein n=1 Tax=Nitratireductor aquimarinus TaxID=889300 RepID=UPI00398F1CC9